MTRWYLIPVSSVKKVAEIGSYHESGELTDLSRGIFLAYADKGLVTGLDSKEEAERWQKEGEYDEKKDLWTKIPPLEARGK